VGAVVVNHDGGARVLRVLSALESQSYPLEQVLVVDNASTDGSVARIGAAFPQVRVLHLERNAGVAIARNAGLWAMRSRLVLFLDHDVYVEPDCVGRMVRAYESHAPAVVCPRVRLLPERDVVQADGAALHFLGTQVLHHGYEPVAGAPEAGSAVDACIGACMLVDRAAVREAGGFDELFFFYFEDLEFSMRMRSRGHRIWCEPSALVFHERAAGTPLLSFRGQGAYPPARAYFTMRNRLLSMLIHYRLRTLLLLSPVLALHELASLALSLRKGCPSEWLRSWGWQFGHLPEIAERRRRMQRLRRLGDRELLVGGPPPLAPGILRTQAERRLVAAYSAVVNGYWALTRRWIA
jgi:GT2 family glycosyltransferase